MTNYLFLQTNLVPFYLKEHPHSPTMLREKKMSCGELEIKISKMDAKGQETRHLFIFC